MTTSSLEERMARIVGGFEQIDRRLTALEQDIRGGFERVDSKIDHLSSRIDHLMYWQLGLLGAIAASTVAVVLTR